jgi:hypothetical protein
MKDQPLQCLRRTVIDVVLPPDRVSANHISKDLNRPLLYQLSALLENSFGCRIFGQLLISATHSCPQLSILPLVCEDQTPSAHRQRRSTIPTTPTGLHPHPNHPSAVLPPRSALSNLSSTNSFPLVFHGNDFDDSPHEDRVARQIFTRPFSVPALTAEADIRESYAREGKNCGIAELGGPPDGTPPTYGQLGASRASTTYPDR